MGKAPQQSVWIPDGQFQPQWRVANANGSSAVVVWLKTMPARNEEARAGAEKGRYYCPSHEKTLFEAATDAA
jgi:hypothetical protein